MFLLVRAGLSCSCLGGFAAHTYVHLQAQPFYQEDVNAGSDDEPELPQLTDTTATAESGVIGSAVAWGPALNPFEKGRAAQRAELAKQLGEQKFMELVAKVRRDAGVKGS